MKIISQAWSSKVKLVTSCKSLGREPLWDMYCIGIGQMSSDRSYVFIFKYTEVALLGMTFSLPLLLEVRNTISASGRAGQHTKSHIKRNEAHKMAMKWMSGTVSGSKLYCRKQPSKIAAAWGRFNIDKKIFVKEHNEVWFETYWDDDISKVGYVMKTYVDAETHPPIDVVYDPQRAIRYALSHSTHGSSGADPARNIIFGNVSTNDCANFVSQCLCCGGLPMFNGWSYALENIPAGWKANSKWKLTYSGCQKLLGKGYIYEITDPMQTRKGDIIYTYNGSKVKNKRYTHVTIAVSDYDSSFGGCLVCGHSVNQNMAKKVLKATKVRIYRVKEVITVTGNEKRIYIPVDGNGATVINDTY